MMPSAAERSRRIDWDAECSRYVTGTESLREVAARLGTTLSVVARHACGTKAERKWNAKRTAHRLRLDNMVRDEAVETQRDNLTKINNRRAEIALAALDKIAALIPGDRAKFRDLIEAAKLGIDQRLQIAASTEPREVGIPMTPKERALIDFALGRPLSGMRPEDRVVLREAIEPAFRQLQGDDPNA